MILSCQGISKSFGEKVILEDASFHIEEREKAALIGNNGAGKTTLLRIIMEEMPCRCRTGRTLPRTNASVTSPSIRMYRDIVLYMKNCLSTKQYIIDMEERLRAMEVEMKNASGEELGPPDELLHPPDS